MRKNNLDYDGLVSSEEQLSKSRRSMRATKSRVYTVRPDLNNRNVSIFVLTILAAYHTAIGGRQSLLRINGKYIEGTKCYQMSNDIPV
jgi:hypothetical protein